MREVESGMRSLVQQAPLVTSWGERLATALVGGGRLLAAGNGGSAAEAQHLTAELVGRWCTDRRPLSAIALTAETSSLTAILNDYGPDEVFARQVEAHGRPGDVLVDAKDQRSEYGRLWCTGATADEAGIRAAAAAAYLRPVFADHD